VEVEEQEIEDRVVAPGDHHLTTIR